MTETDKIYGWLIIMLALVVYIIDWHGIHKRNRRNF
jgi:hypothetical protein